MNTNETFSKKFEGLISSGGHIIGSLVDSEHQLQLGEIYGVETLSINPLILNLFVSSLGAPDFCRALEPSFQLAVVISSPFSMETYQVKGVITSIGEITEDQILRSQYWFENYTQYLQSIGVPEFGVKNLVCQPEQFVTLEVQQIFMQSPAQGTGGAL